MFVADTGCTSHCFKLYTLYDDKQPVRNGLRVGLPNGISIQATHTGLFPVDGLLLPLSTDARCVRIFLVLTIKSLIPISQFGDDGYSAVFTAHTVRLVKDDASTVVVHHNGSNSLWDIDIAASTPTSNPPFPQAHVNSAYKMKTLKDLVLYLHRVFFSPVV